MLAQTDHSFLRRVCHQVPPAVINHTPGKPSAPTATGAVTNIQKPVIQFTVAVEPHRVIQARHYQFLLIPGNTVRQGSSADQVKIRQISQQRPVHQGVIARVAIEAEPYFLEGRLGYTLQRIVSANPPEFPGAEALQPAAKLLRQVHKFLLRHSQIQVRLIRPRHVRNFKLVFQPFLPDLERRRQGKNRAPMLDSLYPSRAETAAITAAINVVDNG